MKTICCSPVIMWYPSQCTREVISLRWPSPQPSATLRDGGGSALGSRLSLLYPKQKSSAHLPNLSKDQAGRVAWQVLTRGTPLNHSCGRVAKLALERRRVQQRCPRAPTQEPGKERRPKNRHSSKAKCVSAGVFCLLPVLALVLWPCPFGFLFV